MAVTLAHRAPERVRSLVLAPTHPGGAHAVRSRARVLAERIPHAELVVLEGAGHLIHVERSERVDELVLDFVRRHRDA